MWEGVFIACNKPVLLPLKSLAFCRQEICFKPLDPDNPNCTITSAMNYWQNDPQELDRVVYGYYDEISEKSYDVDYRDHFLYCVQ